MPHARSSFPRKREFIDPQKVPVDEWIPAGACPGEGGDGDDAVLLLLPSACDTGPL